MAKKISQLTQATEVKSDDVTVIVQDGETKKLPLNMMVTKQDVENKKIAGLAKLDEIEATYENDTYTPTITVKNKSSVKVGEGDGVDYSANVMDGHVKSAILKGQTLVNISKFESNIERTSTGTSQIIYSNDVTMLKTSATYTFIYWIESTSGTSVSNITTLDGTNNEMFDRKILQTSGNLESNFILKFSQTSRDFTGRYGLKFSSLNGSVKLVKSVILEGDYTNVDIPYFEGMTSVKMPVLKTTGKNLFNISQEDLKIIENKYFDDNGVATYSPNYFIVDNFISVSQNTDYTFSFNGGNTGWKRVVLYDENYNFIKVSDMTVLSANKMKFNSESASYIKLQARSLGSPYNFQLEKGTTATTYEPHKSNILTVNEEVELRGLGDMQDELNCLTGEFVQRIGEIILDDGLTYTKTTVVPPGTDTNIYSRFYIENIPNYNSQRMFADKFRVDGYNYIGERLEYGTNGRAGIMILKSRLTTDDVNGLKAYLRSNPITIQYKLASESVKTVDLMPSGTHPSTTPYCWKNGHIQLSSSGLLPNLEYSVVTSRAGQINQNATMIVKNDKRIFDLEILLAGGLVNTTYQALTLQNQVETGLSKVSLNSETEPDYLLYHMIMKLIEEKAYKLDDLTEKVSVFYLYEKLSDEQFETIYSALYPFVEDEIVEEPIVEELPEVVEDEVIM